MGSKKPNGLNFKLDIKQTEIFLEFREQYEVETSILFYR